MLTIQKIPNPSNNKMGICYEIKNQIQTKHGLQIVIMDWYQGENETLHITFVHPAEMIDFNVAKQKDELTYETTRTLYSMLQFTRTLYESDKQFDSKDFKINSDIKTDTTPNTMLLTRNKGGFTYNFTEFSTIQSGFTEIVLAKNSQENSKYYFCFNTALVDLDKRYKQKKEKEKVFVKKYVK